MVPEILRDLDLLLVHDETADSRAAAELVRAAFTRPAPLGATPGLWWSTAMP